MFLTAKGEAYVDLSARRSSTSHSGGSLDEALTVYAIVNALTVNLPDVTAVQILVDGKEVDTLAGPHRSATTAAAKRSMDQKGQ